VVKQIGSGGQAKVYKVVRKGASTSNNTSQNRPNQDSLPQQPVGGLVPPREASINGDEEQKRAPLGNNPNELRARPSAFLGRKNEEKVFAIKVIVKSQLNMKAEFERKQLANEVRAQRALKLCGNTIKLHKLYESERYLNLLMEFQEGGTIGDILEEQKRLKEEDCRIIIAQILLSLDFMTRINLIHRDLKPENVLLNSKSKGVYDVRIADFGYSVQADSPQLQYEIEEDIICGTPGYIAPEAIEGYGYSHKSDIFAVGSILFNLLSLKNLFTGRDNKTVMTKNGECSLDHVDHLIRRSTPLARGLCKKLLSKDPQQ
jgi:serine/threonine protein kinase